jgi:hypothetical protein
LYCFTSYANVEKRQASTETLGVGVSSTLIEVQGLVFTTAGVVTDEAVVQAGSGSSSTGGATSSAKKNDMSKFELGGLNWGLKIQICVLCLLYQ